MRGGDWQQTLNILFVTRIKSESVKIYDGMREKLQMAMGMYNNPHGGVHIAVRKVS